MSPTGMALGGSSQVQSPPLRVLAAVTTQGVEWLCFSGLVGSGLVWWIGSGNLATPMPAFVPKNLNRVLTTSQWRLVPAPVYP